MGCSAKLQCSSADAWKPPPSSIHPNRVSEMPSYGDRWGELGSGYCAPHSVTAGIAKSLLRASVEPLVATWTLPDAGSDSELLRRGRRGQLAPAHLQRHRGFQKLPASHIDWTRSWRPATRSRRWRGRSRPKFNWSWPIARPWRPDAPMARCRDGRGPCRPQRRCAKEGFRDTVSSRLRRSLTLSCDSGPAGLLRPDGHRFRPIWTGVGEALHGSQLRCFGPL
jgi:hypothetical protein